MRSGTIEATQSFQLFVLAVMLLGTSGCGKATSGNETIQGGRGSSGDLSISGGNQVIHEGKPGVLFGTVKIGDGPETFSYLIVYKEGQSLDGTNQSSHDGRNSVSGRTGSTTCAVSINGKTIQADHEIEVGDKREITREQLKVGGKVVDLAAGRLFLIDLTSPSPTYEQKNVELGEIKSLETLKDVEGVASNTLDALKAEIPKDFWK